MPEHGFCELCDNSGWIDGEDDIYLCTCLAGDQQAKEDVAEMLDNYDNSESIHDRSERRADEVTRWDGRERGRR